MRALIEPGALPHHFVSPGHVFPLIANSAGVMARPGHTEGAFDLARLAGLSPSGILCEVLNPDGTMARGAQLQAFAKKHNIRVTSIQAIREHRAFHEIAVRPLSESDVVTDYGTLHATVFADDAGKKEHVTSRLCVYILSA
jgi:3,4-dihydroxy 2-butanone 4-phosphate synthase/GTP cyclohydrolase II